MLLRAERIGEQREVKYAKVIEYMGRYYEAQEEVPLGELVLTQSETDQIDANRMEAQKEANGRLGELLEDLGLALPKDGADEDERRELYAVVASVLA